MNAFLQINLSDLEEIFQACIAQRALAARRTDGDNEAEIIDAMHRKAKVIENVCHRVASCNNRSFV